jgi:uncharacterized membrane protein
MSAALLILLVLACITVVALPLARRVDSDVVASSEALEALEDRDRALAALRELEFDHRAGTIGDDEYHALVGVLRARAAEALDA